MESCGACKHEDGELLIDSSPLGIATCAYLCANCGRVLTTTYRLFPQLSDHNFTQFSEIVSEPN